MSMSLAAMMAGKETVITYDCSLGGSGYGWGWGITVLK